jgi:hypothetical protein
VSWSSRAEPGSDTICRPTGMPARSRTPRFKSATVLQRWCRVCVCVCARAQRGYRVCVCVRVLTSHRREPAARKARHRDPAARPQYVPPLHVHGIRLGHAELVHFDRRHLRFVRNAWFCAWCQ